MLFIDHNLIELFKNMALSKLHTFFCKCKISALMLVKQSKIFSAKYKFIDKIATLPFATLTLKWQDP